MPYPPGTKSPFGTKISSNGVNFSVFSTAPHLQLLLFHLEEKEPFTTITLDPNLHKTDSIWHIFVPSLTPPFEYLYKVTDANGSFLAHDPYAKDLAVPDVWKKQIPYRPRGRVLPQKQPFDWQNTQKSKIPFKEWIIYEMHIRAFTQSPSSNTSEKGLFLGIIEKIPYLVSLGINAVEFLPVFEFPERENKKKNPFTGQKLVNFWGYSTVNFFCPMRRYAKDFPVEEFKTLVRELHKNNIAVILDVVYNHSAENGICGRTFSFKALSKESYYILEETEKEFANYSGTGNTLNCNHPITTKLIVDSLSYWAQEMQVDGFRFDLASVFTRDASGKVLKNPPILQEIATAPALEKATLIAEAWDAAGLYQLGQFPSKWAEWNGLYRDIVRDFIKGTDDKAGAFAQAICGSQNLYSKDNPTKSINFITAHDGYSLHDLVCYQSKHNFSNGENNKDGANDNKSWNCGQEGESSDSQILELRERQRKNFFLALLVSLGVPMILMGDEYGHTRNGNNNPYCQDNELNWFLWDQLEKNKDLFRFVQALICLRKEKKQLFCRKNFLQDKDIVWHGKKPFTPDWSKQSRFIAYELKDPEFGCDCFIAFNAHYESCSITLPPISPTQKWSRKIDTSLPSPYDFIKKPQEPFLLRQTYELPAYSAFLAEKLCL